MTSSPRTVFSSISISSRFRGGANLCLAAILVAGLFAGCESAPDRPRRRTVIVERPAPPPPPPPVIVVEREGRRSPPPVVVIQAPPPPPRQEVIPVRPSQRHIWIAGHWQYYRGEYSWIPGHWDMPPRHYTTYVPGHWEQRGGGHVFIEGHWSR